MSCLMCHIHYLERDSLSRSYLAAGNDVIKKGQMRDTSKRVTKNIKSDAGLDLSMSLRVVSFRIILLILISYSATRLLSSFF